MNIIIKKSKVDFSIIRELYLNKENRNIVNELLKYINRDVRSLFMREIQNIITLCENCFKNEGCSLPICSNKYYFCEKCNTDHLDKYSELDNVHQYSSSGESDFTYKHNCDVTKKTFKIYLRISNSDWLNETGSFQINPKPSIFYYKKVLK